MGGLFLNIISTSSIFFFFFKILIFQVFRLVKGQKSIMLHISGTRSYHQDFWYTGVKRYILVFFFVFFLNTTFANIKILTFLLSHFNSFFNKQFFIKFINKCQKKILRCPTLLYMCVIFTILIAFINIVFHLDEISYFSKMIQ